MAEVNITSTAYTNLHLSAGITSGTALHIQNKTSGLVWLQNIAAQPSGGSLAGFILQAFEDVIVDGSVTNVWAKGQYNGPVFVEAVT